MWVFPTQRFIPLPNWEGNIVQSYVKIFKIIHWQHLIVKIDIVFDSYAFKFNKVRDILIWSEVTYLILPWLLVSWIKIRFKVIEWYFLYLIFSCSTALALNVFNFPYINYIFIFKKIIPHLSPLNHCPSNPALLTVFGDI